VVLRRGDPSPATGLPDAVSRALPTRLPRGWPRLRKNSSGYGLDRWLTSGDAVDLVVGSEGTLLLMTHVTFRLAPRPPARGIAVIPVHGNAEAGAMAEAAGDLGASACEFLGHRLLEMMMLRRDPDLGELARGAHALFLLEFEGPDADAVLEALSRAESRGREIAGRRGLVTTDPESAERLWTLRHRASPLIAELAGQGLHSTQFIEDSVVPPGKLGTYLSGVERILREEGAGMDAVVFGHAGDGNVHVNPLVGTLDPAWRERVRGILGAVADLVAGLGGTLAGEHGDGRLRAPLLTTIWGDEAVGEFRRLKEAFDPGGILNPGVILPLPGQDPLDGLLPGPRKWPG
jgi:FAD/FMN-containing dehydrogenase